MIQNIKNIFNKFIADPRQLFWFFIAVNLIPCVLLVFTEPYSWLGKVILITFQIGRAHV